MKMLAASLALLLAACSASAYAPGPADPRLPELVGCWEFRWDDAAADWSMQLVMSRDESYGVSGEIRERDDGTLYRDFFGISRDLQRLELRSGPGGGERELVRTDVPSSHARVPGNVIAFADPDGETIVVSWHDDTIEMSRSHADGKLGQTYFTGTRAECEAPARADAPEDKTK